jgi:predicted PurR-regulated permease PerM
MRNRRLLINALIPLSTFIAGVLAPIIVDRITKGVTTEQQITLLILLSFALALIVLAIVNSVFFQEAQESQQKISQQLERLSRQFGLKVEFVEDTEQDPGLSYERTTELIRNAQNSLVFVDYWIQTTDYLLQNTGSSYDRRQAYYTAIIEQIRRHRYQLGCHPESCVKGRW